LWEYVPHLDKAVEEGLITEGDRALAHAYLAAHKKEISDFEQAMQDRAATAQGVTEKKANDRIVQERIGTHEHQKSAGERIAYGFVTTISRRVRATSCARSAKGDSGRMSP